MEAVLDTQIINIPEGLEEAPDFNQVDEADYTFIQEEPDLSKIPPEMDSSGTPVKRPNRFVRHRRTVAQIEADLEVEAEMYLKGASQMEIAKWIGENRPYVIGISQIALDLDKIHLRWQLAYLADMNQAKLRELKQIDRVEKALWMAWDRSLMDVVEVERTKIIGLNDTDGKDDGNEIDDEVKEQENWKKMPPGTTMEDAYKEVEKAQKAYNTDGGRKKGSGASRRGLWAQGKGFVREKEYEKRTTTYGDTRILEQVLRCIELRSKILGIITNKSSVSLSWKKDAEEMGIDPEELVNGFRERIMDAAVARGRSIGGNESGQENYPQLPDGG